MSEKIAVIGDGAMGTVCALMLAHKGYSVSLWGYNDEQIRVIRENRENIRFLPGISLPIAIDISSDDTTVFNNAGIVISAVPCLFLRDVWKRLVRYLPQHTPIVSVTKGIDYESLKCPTGIISDIVETKQLATLSGPNIAGELAMSLPATATAASHDPTLAQHVQRLFTTSWFRVYTNDDVIGVEIAGAAKNVIAVAAGIIDGLKAGDNAKAALLTRGLVEIKRLGEKMGAKPATFNGLSGLGDLVTTCISPMGRNRSFGQAVGAGLTVEEALDNIPGQVEGANTCRALMRLADKYGVEMPITKAVYQIVAENKPVAQAMTDLMSRDLKSEIA